MRIETRDPAAPSPEDRIISALREDVSQPRRVLVVGVEVPFGDLVVLWVKVLVAAVPALILLALLVAVLVFGGSAVLGRLSVFGRLSALPAAALHCAERSQSVRRAFQRAYPCPSTGLRSGPCPGFVADHVRALKRGGADSVENLQWMRVPEAREKDRWE